MLQLNSDNMKNKGFTLIELIITITLVAVISLSIGVSVSGMLSRQKEKQAEELKKTIEEAACVYSEVEDTSATSVTLKTLIEAGLLDKDLTNPITKISLEENDKVEIIWDNFEKTCTYNFPGLDE